MKQNDKSIDEIIMSKLNNSGSTYGAMEYDYNFEVLYYPCVAELTLFANNKQICKFNGILAHQKAYEFAQTNIKYNLVIDSKMN